MRTTERISICAKDIQLVTGRVERTARRIIARIRKKYNKPRSTYITVDEFCEHTGLKKEDVLRIIS
jgi:hypothetical protein